ncbi:DNA polymerase alpha, subunit B [Phlebopus sp. FC_14]|nr:DNA polymerase alpha, subunit B [Phlebopus sp. FC_14]
MATEKFRNEIAEHFSEAVAADDALVKECANICKMYNISAENLSYKWQALSYSTTSSLSIFTSKSVPDLKARLHQEQGRANVSKQETGTRSHAPAKFGRARGQPGVISNASISRSLDAPLNVGPLRSSIVKTEVTQVAGPSRVAFEGPRSDPTSYQKRAYRYMYEKVSERSEALDDRIDEFADLVQRHYHIDELGDPDAATEEPVTIVGRIVLDAEASSSSAKLNESSLVLESSRMMGSGVRVPLRLAPETKLRGGLKGINGIGFFPGAIVALRGRNGGGGFFLVDEILELPPINAPSPPPSDPNATFSMCIACGPFTADADLEYKSWTKFLDVLRSTRPAVVLLLGPFIDVSNSRIKEGEINETPETLFQLQFIDKIREFLAQSPRSLVLIVPSVSDIISDHAVFPQREFEAEFSSGDLVSHHRIRLLPNPCRFTVNGVTFGVTSVDVLFHLRKEEYFRRTEEVEPLTAAYEVAVDPMSNLARNILQQRSFYPIFPVPLDVAHEVNLDATHSEGLKLIESEMDAAPDVLILPSRLKQFAKVVDTSMFVNPSFLSKGTYATLSYAGQEAGLPKDRIRTEISKLS